MGFFKALGVVAGAAVAVVAAPIVLPAAAAIGTATLAAGTAAAATVGTAAAAAGTAVASTAVGSVVVGAATTVGTASVAAATTVGTAAAAAGTAVASTAVGSAVVGAATTVGSATVAAATTVGTAAAAAGTAVAGTTVGSSVIGAASAIGVQGAVSGAIGASVTYSAITAVEGISNNAEANRLIEKAESAYARQERKLSASQNQCMKILEEFNLRKLEIYSNELERGIALIGMIQQPTVTEIELLEEDPEMFYSELEIHTVKNAASVAKDALKSMGSGGKVAVGATLGTLSLVTQFGLASTGTAISTLSGVAATNATLAALGGGAVVAGGGGMALGAAVLGGLAIAPLSVVSSWKFAKSAEENLTEATRIYASILEEVEKGKSLVTFIEEAIAPRILEVESAMNKLAVFYSETILPDLENVCHRKARKDGTVNYKACSKKDKETIKMAIYTTRQLRNMIAMKLFDDMGNIRPEVDMMLASNEE